MIHIDNLDGEGTIFMSTDDGTQSIGHVEEEYASILQDVLESYDWYVKEVKRLRERLIRAYDWAENAVNGNDSAMMDYTEYVCGGEEND